MEWFSLAKQLHASLTLASTMPNIRWSGVKHTEWRMEIVSQISV